MGQMRVRDLSSSSATRRRWHWCSVLGPVASHARLVSHIRQPPTNILTLQSFRTLHYILTPSLQHPKMSHTAEGCRTLRSLRDLQLAVLVRWSCRHAIHLIILPLLCTLSALASSHAIRLYTLTSTIQSRETHLSLSVPKLSVSRDESPEDFTVVKCSMQQFFLNVQYFIY